MKQKILVTGAAGFIGSRLIEALSDKNFHVIGIDNLNNYYDPNLKIARLKRTGVDIPDQIPFAKTIPCSGSKMKEVEYPDLPFGMEIRSSLLPDYKFIRLDIEDKDKIDNLFSKENFDVVINLAAQAGVRYSIENPMAYIGSNVVGFTNLLEVIKCHPVKHFVYASSSSVYGGNSKVPFSETDPVDNQVSTYAATKRSNELLANVYAKLYGIPSTGLRFFTVYGPWGRPDMAPMLFADAITTGKPIKVFNHGNLSRDFTYIDDIVEGIVRIIDKIPNKDIPAEIYNIGRGAPMQLMEFISTLENALGKKAKIEFMPMQPGDVYTTYADTTKLEKSVGYRPEISLKDGIGKFVEWFKNPNT